MKKKILAGSLAALILTAAVLFTGCGTVVSSHTSSAAAPAATAQTGSAGSTADQYIFQHVGCLVGGFGADNLFG